MSMLVLDEDIMIDKLFTPLGNWDIKKFKVNFSNYDVEAILKILMGTKDMKDTFIWHFERSGVYSIKNRYCLGKDVDTTTEPSYSTYKKLWWKSLWGLELPLKIKIFIWRAFYDWILTLANLRKKGIKVDRIYPFCKAGEESTVHALWLCHNLKMIRKE
ncbi:hypothetical protein Ddye_020252 [Dipteronia dyeriana]|uniref:Reverse transcriptase zinc-binding domain-containing protein n=1 Tax=Dipteronia dyeriana TaxID=168575 RepID=A0AAD9TZV7_9ROSI|nr:hypothetical protein Ddye_020252 [Dipteronia dyeriana]